MMNSGFLLIDKDASISSAQIDNKIKKIFNIKKVGHLGTLDPLATGLLIIGTLDSTRYFKYFTESRKTYILSLRIGATTPSLDYETEFSENAICNLLNQESLIDKLLEEFPKNYDQYPPIYSAVKVDGKPLYKYAYKEKEVEIKPRNVKIYNIKRINNIEYKDNNSFVSILLDVSKGFYVRSFAKDFSKVLGFPGMSDGIRRIKVDDFSIENAKKIDDINETDFINPLSLLNFRRIDIEKKSVKYILNGAKYKFNTDIKDEYVIFRNDGTDLAIYKKIDDTNTYKMDLLIRNESNIHQ